MIRWRTGSGEERVRSFSAFQVRYEPLHRCFHHLVLEYQDQKGNRRQEFGRCLSGVLQVLHVAWGELFPPQGWWESHDYLRLRTLSGIQGVLHLLGSKFRLQGECRESWQFHLDQFQRPEKSLYPMQVWERWRGRGSRSEHPYWSSWI